MLVKCYVRPKMPYLHITDKYYYILHLEKRFSDFVAILTHLGIEDPKVIADLAARPMRNNFDFYKGEVTRKVYPSVVCNYAFTQGV
ncbi:hypothetical protein NPIL_131511, partial [Nephila pilipes]